MHASSPHSLVNAAVSTPSVALILSPNDEHLYTTTQLTMICSVFVNAAVDTPIKGATTWSGPNGTLQESRRVHINNTVAYTMSYRSFVTFTNLQSSDSGNYCCSVTVYDSTSSWYIMDSPPTTTCVAMTAG